MRINKLTAFVGDWKTTGEIFENPFGSKGELSGTDSYRFAVNHDFVIHSVNVKMAGKKVSNSEVISYDAKKMHLQCTHSKKEVLREFNTEVWNEKFGQWKLKRYVSGVASIETIPAFQVFGNLRTKVNSGNLGYSLN